MNNKLSVKNVPAFIEKFTSAGWDHQVEVNDNVYATVALHTLSFSITAWYGQLVWSTVFVWVATPNKRGQEHGDRSSVKVWSISHYAPKSKAGTWTADYYLKQSKEETEALAQKRAEREARLAANPVA